MRLCQNWELTPLTLCATSPKTGEDYSSFTLTHSLSAASALLHYLRFPTLLLKFWIKVRQSIIKNQGAPCGAPLIIVELSKTIIRSGSSVLRC